jgi:ABC-type Fe3+-hydroxamate transport system substrate-binding protein
MRVVSLVPSATETLVALSVVPVGCTRFCELEDVPTVGGTKNVDVDALVALAPDLVVVNDEENRIEDADAIEACGLALHSMSPRSIGDVGPAVCALARAVGVDPVSPFDAWAGWLDGTRVAARTRAFIPIWRRPWMSLAADTYGSSLLAHVGIDNVFGDAEQRYPEVALREVAVRAPEVVLLPSEPYAFAERHASELRESLAGVRTTFVDGRDLFWWGIRTPAAADRLQRVA